MAKASERGIGRAAVQIYPNSGRRARWALVTLAAAVSMNWLLAPLSRAEESSRTYDKPGVQHNEQCIKTSGNQSVVVRDVEGNQLQTASGPVTDPPEAKEDCSGGAGIRFEGIESVTAKGMTMYYTWPLEGGRQAPGFVWVYELSSRPSLNGGDAAGNGASAPPASGEPAYKITPEDIASEQRYKGPSTGQWYTFSVYGRPIGAAKFALMTWSWIDVEGGGIARAAVAEGETFYPANVQPISLQSSSGENQPANGTVTARYGYVNNGTEKVYGWMVISHTYNGSCYNNMGYSGGGTPLPSTLCPGPVTESVSGVAPQQATLNGLVTPNGSDTHYYFQYGTTPNYGSTQPAMPGGDAGSTGTAPVSTTVALTPGVTYHYRIVVTNSVGTDYGSEQTFTTPGPVEASTSEATDVQQNEAILNGAVNPRGYDAKGYFEYGLTTAYGSLTPEGDAGSGNSAVPESSTIIGLLPGIIYHYRLVATSGGITSYGGDRTFVTPRPAFYFSSSNTAPNGNIVTPFDKPGDVPIMGNWTGQGKDTVGLYRPSTHEFILSNSNMEPTANIDVAFGNPGDIPLVGDWTGQGKDTIGLYRPSTHEFILSNSNTSPAGNTIVTWGNPGDTPLVGDWTGQGLDTIGLYRGSTPEFILSNSNSVPTGSIIIDPPFAKPGDIPLVGDWTGQGKDTIGLYRPSTREFILSNSNTSPTGSIIVTWGNPGDVPLVGDWTGQGRDTIGLYRPSAQEFLLSNSNTSPSGSIIVIFGNLGDVPLVGDWTGQGKDTIGLYRLFPPF
jgi:hypothetical protein